MNPSSAYAAQLPVECPVCNWRHFFAIETEQGSRATALELRRHLEAWLASRCPEHLGPIMEMSKN